ncbi:COG1361 family protein [Thermofilum pendens]|uniref:CARDB domain-containing protein n=1 Tax=Thermofilum pendens (strain DSM 2475 / Hrk 5) TaxID=368408 RepID=A1RYG5_THEPD|nr:hypothetical protein [Thermofilum pendens]ABL78245.1 hypothetical protein Tpen_0844 [Thermofilum pendens Hrk 5]
MSRRVLLGLSLLLLATLLAVNAFSAGTLRGESPRVEVQGYPRLLVYAPPSLNITQGSVGVLVCTVSNVGDAPAENTYLSVVAAGCAYLSTDGENWKKNLTFFLGTFPGHSLRRFTVFVACREAERGRIIVTAVADNHDPVITTVDVAVQPREAPRQSSVEWTPVLAILALSTPIAYYMVSRRRSKEKKKKKSFNDV